MVSEQRKLFCILYYLPMSSWNIKASANPWSEDLLIFQGPSWNAACGYQKNFQKITPPSFVKQVNCSELFHPIPPFAWKQVKQVEHFFIFQVLCYVLCWGIHFSLQKYIFCEFDFLLANILLAVICVQVDLVPSALGAGTISLPFSADGDLDLLSDQNGAFPLMIFNKKYLRYFPFSGQVKYVK